MTDSSRPVAASAAASSLRYSSLFATGTGRGVPANEGTVVQHGIPQLKGTDAAHRKTLIGWAE